MRSTGRNGEHVRNVESRRRWMQHAVERTEAGGLRLKDARSLLCVWEGRLREASEGFLPSVRSYYQFLSCCFQVKLDTLANYEKTKAVGSSKTQLSSFLPLVLPSLHTAAFKDTSVWFDLSFFSCFPSLAVLTVFTWESHNLRCFFNSL